MVDWYYYPKNEKCPSHLMKIIEVFNQNFSRIDSNMYQDKSDVVLSHLRNDFEALGYLVEKGKHKDEKIKVPVLYGKTEYMKNHLMLMLIHLKIRRLLK